MPNRNRTQFESNLFKAADKLRRSMDAAEYKHIVMGLIFLNYISYSFEQTRSELLRAKNKANHEDPDEYTARHKFWLPPNSRWDYLVEMSGDSDIGHKVDRAMLDLERANEALSGILPKVYSRGNLPSITLTGLIKLIDDAAIPAESSKGQDILGRVYEYFLGMFSLKEGQKGGQFYTPKSIVKLLVELVQPFKGRVYDPCCGSGGMFIMSEKFTEANEGDPDDLTIFGQESNQTTYRLCRMNLAIRNLDGSQVIWNNEGSLLNDAHHEKQMDYILANPPFNDSDWSGEFLQDDYRWTYGKPPEGNANFAWVQHFIHHLNPNGVAGFVLANGSLSTKIGGGEEIRKNIVEDGLVDCIVNLPTKLFINTQIPACLWLISRKKPKLKRDGKILFINADGLGSLNTNRIREFNDEEINQITNTFLQHKKRSNKYQDIPGFCKSISLGEIRANQYNLSPQRYINTVTASKNHKNSLNGSFKVLKNLFEEQLSEESTLNKQIMLSLSKLTESET